MDENLMTTSEDEITLPNNGDDVTSPEEVLYWTCAQAVAYIATLDEEIQERFAQLQALRGITIPNTSAALRSAQIELIMDAI
jgi:hypothetical protein